MSMRTIRDRARAAALATSVAVWLAASLSGCFLGYDSRWGQAKASQRSAAAAQAPSSLDPSSPPTAPPTTTDGQGERRAGTRVLRVRARVAPSYSAQVLDWPKHVAALFDDANRVLEPACGARLVLHAKSTWDEAPSEALPAALRALHEADDGAGADIVVGLVGGLPRDAASFHELGYADVVGKHVILRAAASSDEAAAIERGYDALSAEERARLLRQRVRHRETAILLHEIGHALGALHERDAQSLMHPRYDRRMSTFSAAAAEVMRVRIAHLPATDDGGAAAASGKESIDAGLAGDLIASYKRAPEDVFASGEREEALARLERVTMRASAPSPVIEAPDPVAALSDADRALYAKATSAFQAGAVAFAWQTAAPLFEKYASVYAVQDLRCQLAIVRRLDQSALEQACALVKQGKK